MIWKGALVDSSDARVDWPALREWCLAHGAKNDSITFIRIDGRGNQFNVILEGHEFNEQGSKFVVNGKKIAKWRTTQPLRFFP